MLSIIKYFNRALSTYEPLTSRLKGGIWPIAIPDVDEDPRRPYVVITSVGSEAEDSTKDTRCPSLCNPQVRLLVVADDPDELSELVEIVEGRVQEYAESEYDQDTELRDALPFYVEGVTPREETAEYFYEIPAYVCPIAYQCDTNRK